MAKKNKVVKKAVKRPAKTATLARKPAAKEKTKVVKTPVASRKPAAVQARPAPKTTAKPAPAKTTAAPAAAMVKTKLSAEELKFYRDQLNKLRDRVVDGISFLAGDNLNRSQRESSGDLSSYSFHMADHGTDNYDREFALNLVSSEQDALYEIDEALARINEGIYGLCDGCGKAIEKARLKALPFTKMCVECKQSAEKGKTRYRPFGATLQQMPET